MRLIDVKYNFCKYNIITKIIDGKFIIIIIFIRQDTDVPMLLVWTHIIIHIVLYLLDSMLKNTINILYTIN